MVELKTSRYVRSSELVYNFPFYVAPNAPEKIDPENDVWNVLDQDDTVFCSCSTFDKATFIEHKLNSICLSKENQEHLKAKNKELIKSTEAVNG